MSDAPMLQVGGQVFPEGIFNEIAEAICVVMEAAHETHADQETVRAALAQFAQIAKVENVTITGSTFTNRPGTT